jgi:hypothetical protein
MATASLPAHPSNEIKDGQEKVRKRTKLRDITIVSILLSVAFIIFRSQLHPLAKQMKVSRNLHDYALDV